MNKGTRNYFIKLDETAETGDITRWMYYNSLVQYNTDIIINFPISLWTLNATANELSFLSIGTNYLEERNKAAKL